MTTWSGRGAAVRLPWRLGIVLVAGLAVLGVGGGSASAAANPCLTIVANVVTNGVSCVGPVEIPNTVTSVGTSAFARSAVTSVSFESPSSVQTIGGYAFTSASSLGSIGIPSSVTSIGVNAFCGASSLAAFSVEAGSASYSTDAEGVLFNAAKTTLVQYPPGRSGTAYTIPSSVTGLGVNAFCGASSLAVFSVEAGSASYSADAQGALFNAAKTTLVQYPLGRVSTSYVIPASVVSIGDAAFSAATRLSSVSFASPSNVETIGSAAFYRASSLASIRIPRSVTSIAGDAFSGARALADVYFEGVTAPSVGEDAFYDVAAGATAHPSAGATGFTTAGSPPRWNGLLVSAIPYTCLAIDAGVVTDGTACSGPVTIPAGVTAIDAYAFNGSTGVTSVTFAAPSHVETIGNAAFRDATALTSITLPSSLTSLGNEVFRDAIALRSVSLPSTLTSLGMGTFWGTTSLSTIALPNELSSIDGFAFQESGLSSIVIPAGVTDIGVGAFWGATGLTSIAIPAGVTTVDSFAFYLASSLTSVTFEEGVGGSRLATIGDYAFQDSGLTSISIPSGVSSIGVNALRSSRLTEMTVAADNTFFSSSDGVLFDKPTTTLIQYPLGRAGAYNAMPGTVTTVGVSAFESAAQLTSITVPASVMTIDASALRNTTGLTHIYFEGAVAPSVGTGAFSGNAAGATAYHVPGSTGYDPLVEPNLGSLGSALYLPAPPAPTALAAAEAAVISVQQPPVGPAPSSFLVTASPGGAVCAINGSSGSCTIGGLTAGIGYTFTALAHLSSPSLTSFPSSASALIIPTASVAPSASTATTAGVPNTTSAKAAFTTRDAPRQLADALAVTVVVNEPGVIGVRVTARGARALRAAPTVLCSMRQRVTRAGRVTLICSYTRAARVLLARGDVRAMQTIRLRPLAGAAVVATSTLTVKRLSVSVPSQVTG